MSGAEPGRRSKAPDASPWLLALLGLAELSALAALGWWPAAHRFPLPGLAIFALAFVAYALAAWRGGPRPSRRVVWLFAVAMRLVLLPLTPELSDDVYRYLRDGHVQLAGVNPYLHAPADDTLPALRIPDHARINNPSVPTIYPPLAQLAFLMGAFTGSSILVLKLLWLACDLATAWVLVRIARATGRDEGRVLLLYAWAPLLIVEVAWSAHLEPLGLLFLALAILWSVRAGREGDDPRPRRSWSAAAGAALALSACTKLAPAAALPALTRRRGWPAVTAFVAACLVLYLPYVAAGNALFTGLRTYGEHWWFMKGAFAVLEWLAGDPQTARMGAGALVVAVVAWTVHRRFDLERTLLWTLGAGMIVTPTLHPWYVLWMLPMAALRASRPWILLSGLAFVGYFGLTAFQETGVWPQPLAVRAALWGPFFVMLAADTRHMLRDRNGAVGGHGGPQTREPQGQIAREE